MTDQFDLEQQIMACWMVTSDINDLLEEVMENNNLTKDQISNVLLGLNALYEIKFNKLFRTFEQMIKDRQFAVPDATFGSAYIAPLNPRAISDAEFDAAHAYVEALELPPPVTTKAKKKVKRK